MVIFYGQNFTYYLLFCNTKAFMGTQRPMKFPKLIDLSKRNINIEIFWLTELFVIDLTHAKLSINFYLP